MKQLVEVISSQLDLIRVCLSITRLEIKLAQLSAYPFLMCLSLLVVCIVGLWTSGFLCIGLLLMSMLHSAILATGVIVAMHLLCFIVILKRLHLHLKRMQFEKTRLYLSTYLNKQHELH